MRVCGNCGSKDGPFEVYRIGTRTNAQNIFTCRTDYKAKDVVDQKKPVVACLARRNKQETE